MSLSISSYVFTQSSVLATGHVPPLIEWALTGAALPWTVLAFALVYVYLPNCSVAWRDAAVGGLIAAVAFELAKRGFGYYVRRMPTYTAVYGAFALVPLFLLWVYLCWFITLAGATIVSALPAIRLGQFHRRHYAGSDLLDALELLVRLDEAREAGKPGLAPMELARMLRCDIDTVTRLLARLRRREWVTQLADGGASRYVLIANPTQVTVGRLFDLFVIDRPELEYQLRLDSTRVDTALLLDALHNPKLDLTLAVLVAARSARGALDGSGKAVRSPWPHQPA